MLLALSNVTYVLIGWFKFYYLSFFMNMGQWQHDCVYSSLAKSQQYDEDGLMDIFTQYGDHLYDKGDHDGAIDQYIKTIGKLEASYVIRKV